MKVAIYDQDMLLAAGLYRAVEKSFKGVSVDYYDNIVDPTMAKSTVVIADPYPANIREWLNRFRLVNGSIPLVLVSNAPDLLSGSIGDGSYAITKPYNIREVLEVIRYIAIGKPYNGGMEIANRGKYGVH